MERVTLTAGKEGNGLRLDVFITKNCNSLSRAQAQKLIAQEYVLVNGKTEKANYRVNSGDIITCSIPEPKPLEIKPERIALEIIYEDQDLLVVNKPRGMVVHPASGSYSGTLVNALLSYCTDLSGINGELRPGIVHRLDKDTSGLLVVAKNDLSHRSLAAQIKEHTVKREYLALVHGVVAEPGGIIDAPIGRHVADRKKMAVSFIKSRNAVTEYTVLERLENHTLLKCRLRTGRTHQIRVHLGYIRHPLVGDPKYGPSKTKTILKGQALHAGTLGFSHPRTGEWLEFSVQPPPVFLQLLRELKSRYLNCEQEGRSTCAGT